MLFILNKNRSVFQVVKLKAEGNLFTHLLILILNMSILECPAKTSLLAKKFVVKKKRPGAISKKLLEF